MLHLCKAKTSHNIYGITTLLFRDKLHLTSTGTIIKGAALLWLGQHASNEASQTSINVILAATLKNLLKTPAHSYS